MVETRKEQALWTQINPVPAAYSWLTEDISVDVAVIGGGVTGALCALRLQEEGVETALLSSGPIGYGEEAGSSGTAHYEMPGGMARLAEKIGIDRAVRAFGLCREGVEMIDNLVHNLDSDCGCRRSDSLLFAAQENEVDKLRQEYLLRKHNGLPVEYLSRERANDLFSFEISAGIVSKRMSVSIDPYRFTHAVLARAAAGGVKIYENTAIEEVSCAEDTQILLASTHKKVRCGKLILAVGAEAKSMLPGVSGTRTSFSIATDPISIFAGWPGKCVISSFSGELVFSVTPDNRIVAQGLESGMTGMRGKLTGVIPKQAFQEKKYAQLSKEVERLFPGIRKTEAEHPFCYEYPVTGNGLPIISKHKSYPGCIFAICNGVSGLAFAPIAAKHVAEMVLEESNPDHAIFFTR